MTDLRADGDVRGMEPLPDDATLLARSATDPEAFGAIYERHGVAVRRYLIKRVGALVGEDLAAETFIRAFRSCESYQALHRSALPWLLGIANNVIGDHRRLERRRLAVLERVIAEDQAISFDGDTGLTFEVVRALRRLSASDRDTLLLIVWGELSRDEVAAALGVPVGTVNSRIARARRRLASDLAPLRHPAPKELRLNGEGHA